MANSYITIEFTAIPVDLEYLGVDETLSGFALNEVFKTLRTGAVEAEIPANLATDFISQNYAFAIDQDYNALSQFTIVNVNGTPGTGLGAVTITANYPNAVFSVPNLPAFATVTINNIVVPPPNGVYPAALTFNVDAQVPGASSKILSIVTGSDSWTIANTLPSWLQASAMIGSSTTDVIISPINYGDMFTGTYYYNLVITIGTDVFTILVTFNVVSNITTPFKEGNIYFTEAEDYIQFEMDTANTYIQMDIAITAYNYTTNAPVVYNRSYSLPLFKGKTEFHVGTIVHDLFDSIKELAQIVNSFTSNYFVNQYRPAQVAISFEEKAYGAYTGILSSGSFPVFKMARGSQPFTTENQLCLLTVAQQEVIRITPGSPIATSFVFFGTPRIIVMKNNKKIDDFEIPEVAGNHIYSYFRFVDDLKPGDSIELIVVNDLETRSQRFLVMPIGLERTFFFFENNNQMLEPFEFTGRRRIGSNISSTKKTVVNKLKTYDTKAFANNLQSMIVDSGQLTKTEHRILTALCLSTNVWCSLDTPEGPYFKVDAITNKVQNEDTSSSDESMPIEFNILEKANANIYPR
ncbi:MAG: hypothetical protein RLZZ540_268 [Bacteroidota bacterium]|jgi:hypothetical protein